MRFRKLRIVWSVMCGIACMLLVVLWVRSYWRAEIIARVYSGSVLTIGSNHGTLYFVFGAATPDPARVGRWSYGPIGVAHTVGTLELKFLNNLTTGTVPDWLLVACCLVAVIIPWIQRFSLRTLLIAMTLVAVVLGLIVAVVGWQAG
jgi:hypothetical protein